MSCIIESMGQVPSIKLIQKAIKILNSKGLSSKDMEKLTTLIWDISTASYNQGAEKNAR